jgi:hypothetical protein
MSTPGVAVGSAWSGRRGWSPGWAITVAAVGALLALVPVALALAALVAVLPALRAARVRPARVLRAD